MPEPIEHFEQLPQHLRGLGLSPLGEQHPGAGRLGRQGVAVEFEGEPEFGECVLGLAAGRERVREREARVGVFGPLRQQLPQVALVVAGLVERGEGGGDLRINRRSLAAIDRGDLLPGGEGSLVRAAFDFEFAEAQPRPRAVGVPLSRRA